MDTPRDSQLLRRVISHLTLISFATQLEGRVSKFAVHTAYKSLHSNLQRNERIKATSQIVRYDMICKQQHRLPRELLSTRKMKEIKLIAEGWVRLHKATAFLELAAVIQFAFGEHDVHQKSGSGLQSHPRVCIIVCVVPDSCNSVYQCTCNTCVSTCVLSVLEDSITVCILYTSSILLKIRYCLIGPSE